MMGALPVSSSDMMTRLLFLDNMAADVDSARPLAWAGQVSTSPAFVSMYGCDMQAKTF
jgi:hypothetical protein